MVCLDLVRVVHFDKMLLQRPMKPGRVDLRIPTWMNHDRLERKIAVDLA